PGGRRTTTTPAERGAASSAGTRRVLPGMLPVGPPDDDSVGPAPPPHPINRGQAHAAGGPSARPTRGPTGPWFKNDEVTRARPHPPAACAPDGRPPGRERTRPLPARQQRGPRGRAPDRGQAARHFTGHGTGARQAAA